MSAGPVPGAGVVSARVRLPRSRFAVLVLYAAAMGWLEAVVVLYIRGVLGFEHGALPPPPERIGELLTRQPWVLPTEQTREVATLVMLGAVAWLAGRAGRSRLGAFLVAFGVWDIVYYVALWALVRWPSSLGTMDLLFLTPPSPLWNQPVWVPIAISCGMIVLGAWMMRDPAPPPRPAGSARTERQPTGDAGPFARGQR